MQGATPTPARITVFNLDALAPVGEIPDIRANGAAVDAKSGHGFASSKPIVIDAKTVKVTAYYDSPRRAVVVMDWRSMPRIQIVRGATTEAFSSHGNGTIIIVKETSPTNFAVEQNLNTMVGAKVLTLD